jgi:hypothetical protein
MSSEIDSNGGFELEKSLRWWTEAARLQGSVRCCSRSPIALFIDGERWFTIGAKGISSGREAIAHRVLRARTVRPGCNGASLSE